MNHTENYQLPKWEKSDRIMMDDFNDMTGKIDTALGALAKRTDRLFELVGEAVKEEEGQSLVLSLDHVDWGKYAAGVAIMELVPSKSNAHVAFSIFSVGTNFSMDTVGGVGENVRWSFQLWFFPMYDADGPLRVRSLGLNPELAEVRGQRIKDTNQLAVISGFDMLPGTRIRVYGLR